MSLIDVQELIARYDHAEHAEKADAYFRDAAANPYYWRKPFYSSVEASVLLRNLSQVMFYSELYQGARLLDFGAGSCWSSRMFAYLGCRVIAVDISVNALRLGEEIISKDPLRAQLDIQFRPYDGVRLPFEDGEIDRVVCLDCFHHVADQRATLEEFFRVLRPGGIVAFSEAGPEHSKTPQSQYEMRTHGVIENDIKLDQIWRQAAEIGFADIGVCHTVKPRRTSIAEFDQLISGKVDSALAERVINDDAPNHANERIFFLYKGGGPTVPRDSRLPGNLIHELSVTLERRGDALYGRFTAKNVGGATWLPSGQSLGAVNVGVHLHGPDGALIALDHARIPVSDTPVEPGETREADFILPLPEVAGGRLEFDLVAEGVAWFQPLGSATVSLDVPA